MSDCWHAGIELATQNSQVQSPAIPLSHSNPSQVVHTHVPLFTKQYKLVLAYSSDALKLEDNGRPGKN